MRLESFVFCSLLSRVMMCVVLRVSDCVSTLYSSRYARSSVLLLVILALVGVPYLSSWWSSIFSCRPFSVERDGQGISFATTSI